MDDYSHSSSFHNHPLNKNLINVKDMIRQLNNLQEENVKSIEYIKSFKERTAREEKMARMQNLPFLEQTYQMKLKNYSFIRDKQRQVCESSLEKKKGEEKEEEEEVQVNDSPRRLVKEVKRKQNFG